MMLAISRTASGQRGVRASAAHALGRCLTSVRGVVARRYKRAELRMYVYESQHDPEVQAWIADMKRLGPPSEVRPVSEVVESIVGRERSRTAAAK